eukprot:357894-Chlamydomonas_euryale.AAC.2
MPPLGHRCCGSIVGATGRRAAAAICFATAGDDAEGLRARRHEQARHRHGRQEGVRPCAMTDLRHDGPAP